VKELVQEQLMAGHIVPSTSPWNTPIFTIPKKSGKWLLLRDLRASNAVMEDVGALQPGLLSSVMLPENWDLLVIDLKDCFFTIPLHPDDAECLLLSVPSVNKAEPAQRYHWVVLPQGMKNSPTMCQNYVAWALQPLRLQFPELIICHYMDDILMSGRTLNHDDVLAHVKQIVEKRGLKIAPEKVQKHEPWKYLGWTTTGSAVRPQKLAFKKEINTL
ncbi:hypothetical protein N300_01856, partial [Calypte anna]